MLERITPIKRGAREALGAYLRRHSGLGDAPLLAGLEDVTRSIVKGIAGVWLRQAEKPAKLDHMERDCFHALRCLWASEQPRFAATDTRPPVAGNRSR